jgi:hypothetical protein
MGSLANNQSDEFLKMLFMGDPGSGKTGALTALVKAGYKLRIIDFDNLLGSLKQYVKKECPELIDNVSYQTFTDKYKADPNPIMMIGGSARVSPLVDGIPSAYTRALKQMTYWKTADEDFGSPESWGNDCVLVVDSLTSMALAAYRYAMGMNPGAREGQTHYFSAQQLVMNALALLASEQIATNVIVIAHVDYDKNHQGLTKGFPRSIGSAINSQIAGVFNSVLLAESQGSGGNVKRTIRTNSTGIVDLKNPVSFRLPDTLPLETGLADFFTAVKAA